MIPFQWGINLSKWYKLFVLFCFFSAVYILMKLAHHSPLKDEIFEFLR
jgi:hypothetical protein